MSWVKIDDEFPDHKKVASLSNDAFCLHVTAMCWVAKWQTDGKLPSKLLGKLAWRCQDPASAASELVTSGVWETTPEGWEIHDFLEYNPSKAQIAELAETRSEAGKAGAMARWQNHSKPNGKTHSKPHGKKMPPSPSPSPITESNIQLKKYESSSSNGRGAEDALIDPELAQALGKWKETFTGTPYEANPPIAQLPKWLAYAGAEVMCYMIGKAKDKDNPGGYLFTTFDNWRKDGEVAPYVVKAAQDAKIAEQPIVMKTVKVDYGDGTFGEVEVQTRGT